MEHLVTVVREPGRVRVVVRPYRRWGFVLGCLVVVGIAAALLLVGIPPGARVSELVRVALLGIGAYAGYAAVLSTAWHLVGREIVTATPASLTIEHFIVRRRRILTSPDEVVRCLPHRQWRSMAEQFASAPAWLAYKPKQSSRISRAEWSRQT